MYSLLDWFREIASNHPPPVTLDIMMLKRSGVKAPAESTMRALGVHSVDELLTLIDVEGDGSISLPKLERFLASHGQSLATRLIGLPPRPCTTKMQFLTRLYDTIRSTTEERLHLKEHLERMCVLDSEYVGTLDFNLEMGDLDFLWRKGYATTMAWLDMHEKRARDARRAAVDALSAAESQDAGVEGAGPSDGVGSGGSTAPSGGELREKIGRLERELSALRSMQPAAEAGPEEAPAKPTPVDLQRSVSVTELP